MLPTSSITSAASHVSQRYGSGTSISQPLTNHLNSSQAVVQVENRSFKVLKKDGSYIIYSIEERLEWAKQAKQLIINGSSHLHKVAGMVLLKELLKDKIGLHIGQDVHDELVRQNRLDEAVRIKKVIDKVFPTASV